MNSQSAKTVTTEARNKSAILKTSIFATGLAGIVAEYVISTLASYLLGNTILQWTLVVSLMLFSMGLGSRISRYIKNALLDSFIILEFLLSLVCASSALIAYTLSAYLETMELVVYPLAMLIGTLIGLEIPIATRLNDYYEELRINVSAVLEKDYFGSLLGGIVFAFIALPYLGLTYTPILLGGINFLVAAVLFWQFRELLRFRKVLTLALAMVPLLLILLGFLAEPVVLFGEQKKYRDKVIFEMQTPYQRIVITQWKNDFWLYLNGNEQFSSFDEERYHEPLVHPAMLLAASRKKVLILGGGDGLAAREVLKYPEVESVTLVDLDPQMTRLGQNYPLFVELNRNSLNNPRVKILNQDAGVFLRESPELFDVILIDLPDPKTVELARLYTVQFYQLVALHLSRGGVAVTQATSPFFSREAFLCIHKSMDKAGLTSLSYHNHIPTLGEWGWVLGMKGEGLSAEKLKQRLLESDYSKVETRFLNRDAALSMFHFGKDIYRDFEKIKPNDEMELSLLQYYKNGLWDLY
ncbi:MAG: polyamine aminopropyltransferase [Calditrichia bacterium]